MKPYIATVKMNGEWQSPSRLNATGADDAMQAWILGAFGVEVDKTHAEQYIKDDERVEEFELFPLKVNSVGERISYKIK